MFDACLSNGLVYGKPITPRQTVKFQELLQEAREELCIANCYHTKRSKEREMGTIFEYHTKESEMRTIFEYCKELGLYAAKNRQGTWFSYKSKPEYNKKTGTWNNEEGAAGCAKILADVDYSYFHEDEGPVLINSYGRIVDRPEGSYSYTRTKTGTQFDAAMRSLRQTIEANKENVVTITLRKVEGVGHFEDYERASTVTYKASVEYEGHSFTYTDKRTPEIKNFLFEEIVRFLG